MLSIFLLSLLSTCLTTESATPVAIGVYIESLCPYSREFIINQLTPTYNKLHSIIALELVPFGNAKYTIVNQTKETFDVTFECQHGAQECLGNEIQSCAVSNFTIDKSLAFVNCMFSSTDWKTPTKSGIECATKLNLDWNFLAECSSSRTGRGLVLNMAEKTKKLNPPHQYVPWITINGKHTDDLQNKAQTGLLKVVCDTYNGTKPQECLA